MRKRLRTTLPLAFAALYHAAFVTAESSLTVWVFPHDDLADVPDRQLQADYLDPWLQEMREVIDMPVHLRFQRNIPGLTDLDYRSALPSATLATWSDAVWAWRRQQNAPGGIIDNKYLLLTSRHLDHSEDTLGMAHQTGHAAIASIQSYATAGHELGHTLSATHEAARVGFNGWFCETYMFPDRFDLRSHCYRYSEENRANIARYLRRSGN
ncbi:hypothetical protein [Pseudomonas putida]|uniref:Reprolysin-like metallo-peptidase family M12B n=1 Tax=Pseudomonas putida TaxID=303 RepID=A0A1Q9QXL1_PSEPU|nr:hypothetical protein [Pseudomonas putida]OLS59858.1 hypothetical protein PSEMO_51660 [Pseudomonas putida]